MWALAPLASALALRFAATAAVTALAAGALVTVAALVEGHPPRGEALWAVAPLAGLVGAAWTLGGWRSGGEDVGLAALGITPAVAAVWLVLLAAPLLWVGPGAARSTGPDLRVRPGEVVFDAGHDAGHGAVRWSWTDDGAVVVTRGEARAVLPPLPSPTTISTVRELDGLPPGVPRLACAALLLGWLVRRRATPGPALVLIGATIAFVGSHLWVRLI